MYLPEFLKHYSRTECIELNTLVHKGDGTLGNTVVSLLQKHNADKKAINKYKKKCSEEMNQQFERLMSQVKELDQ